MQILYHHQLCPLSRQIRIFLKEFDTDFTLRREDYWLRRKEFLHISPSGCIPALEIQQNISIVGSHAIIEYMNETYDNFYFMQGQPIEKAKVREYTGWFNDKFYREVSKILVDEKMIRLLMQLGEPRTSFIHVAKANLQQHLKFLTSRLVQNSFIVSEQISCADIAAASHISIVDYFGEINWDNWEVIKQWYAIIKSRPSFQLILLDRIPGFNPPKWYEELDF
jgi:glutathione S-transferase